MHKQDGDILSFLWLIQRHVQEYSKPIFGTRLKRPDYRGVLISLGFCHIQEKDLIGTENYFPSVILECPE